MPDESLYRLRVVYAKRGRLALLSHLEVARALERTVRRSGLPFAITNGFSPHMKIAFGSALPVGVGGSHELFDVYLQSRMSAEEALSALIDAGVPDLMALSADYIDLRSTAASAAFPFSTYVAMFAQDIQRADAPETVTVVRKGTERVLTVADFMAEPMSIDGSKLSFVLVSKPTGSLRPDILVRHIAQQNPNLQMLSLTRTAQNS